MSYVSQRVLHLILSGVPVFCCSIICVPRFFGRMISISCHTDLDSCTKSITIGSVQVFSDSAERARLSRMAQPSL